MSSNAAAVRPSSVSVRDGASRRPRSPRVIERASAGHGVQRREREPGGEQRDDAGDGQRGQAEQEERAPQPLLGAGHRGVVDHQGELRAVGQCPLQHLVVVPPSGAGAGRHRGPSSSPPRYTRPSATTTARMPGRLDPARHLVGGLPLLHQLAGQLGADGELVAQGGSGSGR